MSEQLSAMKLLFSLRALVGELSARNRLVSALAGLRESDLAVLDILHRDGPQTPTVLAKRVRVHAATMTGILSRLQRDGWIARRVPDDDLRSFRIHPVSAERLAELFTPANSALVELFKKWSPDELNAMTGLLDMAAQTVKGATDDLAETAGKGISS